MFLFVCQILKPSLVQGFPICAPSFHTDPGIYPLQLSRAEEEDDQEELEFVTWPMANYNEDDEEN